MGFSVIIFLVAFSGVLFMAKEALGRRSLRACGAPQGA